MTDLLTLPASDLVARIKTLEAALVQRKHAFITLSVAHDEALERLRDARMDARAAHNAAIESAALLADQANQYSLGAAIRGLRR